MYRYVVLYKKQPMVLGEMAVVEMEHCFDDVDSVTDDTRGHVRE